MGLFAGACPFRWLLRSIGASEASYAVVQLRNGPSGIYIFEKRASRQAIAAFKPCALAMSMNRFLSGEPWDSIA